MAIVKSLSVHGKKPNAQALGSKPQQLLATLREIDKDGVPWISLARESGQLVQAYSALPESDYSVLLSLPVQVVILLSSQEDDLPVITAVVRSKLPASVTASPMKGMDITIDGRRMNFVANEQISLQCGKSSILLRRDGKVVIKGTQVVSRASGTNKLKGSSVNIN